MTTTLNNVEIGNGVNKLNIKNSVLSDTTTIDAYEIVTDAASGLRIGAGTSVDSNPEWINDFMIAFERTNGNNGDITIKNSSSTLEIKPNAITFSANNFNFNTPTIGSLILKGINAHNDYTQLTNATEFLEGVIAKTNLQVDNNLTVGKSETSGNQDVDLYADVFIRGDLSLNGNLNLPNNSIKPEHIDSDLGADYTVDICMNEALIVGGDVSFHNKLDVNGNTTFNGLVSLNDATIMRGNVYAAKDLHIYGNLKVDHVENQSTYNIEQTNYQVVTVDELSLNGRIFIQDDASFNKNVYIKDDLTVDGNINGVSSVQLGHLTSITSNVQTQFDNVTSSHQALSDSKHDKITSSSKLSASLIGTSGLVTNAHFDALQGVTSNIQNQIDSVAPDYNVDIHMTKTLTVDGDTTIKGNLKADQITNEYIINTSTTTYSLIVAEDLSLNGKLLIQDDASFNKDVYVKDNILVDGNINGISKTELGYLSGVTSDIQTQITANTNATSGFSSQIAGKQDIIDSSNRLSATNIGANGLVTDTNFGYLAGATSNLQNQITINTNSITNNASLISNKQNVINENNRLSATNIGANGNVTDTKFGYLSGVTSDIQTQLTANADATSGFSSQIAGKQDIIDSSNRLSATNIGANGLVTDTNFGYLAGASGNLQNQITINTNSITNNASQILNKQSLINENNRLSATNIGANGNVTDTKFGYLSGVTSDIQTQIDNVAADYTIDICMNKTLTVGGDASFNGDVVVNGNVTAASGVFIGNVTGNADTATIATTATSVNYLGLIGTAPTWNQNTTGNALTATTATNANTVTNSTQSAITKLGVLTELEVAGDVTIDGNLKADKITNDYILNTETTNYTLIVAEDLSLNGKLIVIEDASLNSNLSVAGNINDVTNAELSYLSGVTSNIQTQINNATADYTIDICMNKTLTVGGDASFNGDVVVNGNVTAASGVFIGNVTGNADTATTAATATSVNYSGLTGTAPIWNQDTTGNAATATTATSVNYSGLTGTVPTWNQDTTGNASTATTATTVTNPTQSVITSVGTLVSLSLDGDITSDGYIHQF